MALSGCTQAMPNPKPVEGKCNAARADGFFCANKPALPSPPGNGRCKFHGGLSKIIATMRTPELRERLKQNPVKHGLYAKTLERAFKNPEDAKLFRNAPRETDLGTEIALIRTKIAKFHKMLEDGIEVVETHIDPSTGQPRQADVELLLVRAVAILQRLTKAQHEMHPEASKAGAMRITITVDGAQADNTEPPDLEAQAALPDDELPAGGADVQHAVDDLTKFEGLDE